MSVTPREDDTRASSLMNDIVLLAKRLKGHRRPQPSLETSKLNSRLDQGGHSLYNSREVESNVHLR